MQGKIKNFEIGVYPNRAPSPKKTSEKNIK
jgi:hypothetical protein